MDKESSLEEEKELIEDNRKQFSVNFNQVERNMSKELAAYYGTSVSPLIRMLLYREYNLIFGDKIKNTTEK